MLCATSPRGLKINYREQRPQPAGKDQSINQVIHRLKAGETLIDKAHTRTCSMQGMLPEREGLLGLWRVGSPGLEVGMWLHEEVRAMKWSL